MEKIAILLIVSLESMLRKTISSKESLLGMWKTSLKAGIPPFSHMGKLAQAKLIRCLAILRKANNSVLSPAHCTLLLIFRQAIFSQSQKNSMISCSMLQIYNEKMMDLFVFPQPANHSNSHSNSINAEPLKLKEINDQIFIDGLVEIQVQNKSEILDLVRLGHRNRKVASTYNNDASSRSHTILFVYRTF